MNRAFQLGRTLPIALIAALSLSASEPQEPEVTGPQPATSSADLVERWISDDGFFSPSGLTPYKRYETDLEAASFAGKPQWNLDEPNPPLSARQALVSAIRFAQKFDNGEFAGCRATSIELTPFDGEKGDWIYQVTFRSFTDGSPPMIYIVLAVFMDGTVAEPGISARQDAGWPLPGEPVPEKSARLTNVEIVTAFAKHLNDDWRFAGLRLQDLKGKFFTLPTDHPLSKSGRRYGVAFDDGTELAVEFPGGPVPEDGTLLRFDGILVGYRDLESLPMIPGIRMEGYGVVR